MHQEDQMFPWSEGGSILANQELAAPVCARWMGQQAADIRTVSSVLSTPAGRTLGLGRCMCQMQKCMERDERRDSLR